MLNSSIHLHPQAIIEALDSVPDGFTYPRYGEADEYAGFGTVAVIPLLHNLMLEQSCFPSPQLAYNFLLTQTQDRDVPRVQRRAQKLYLDFARDMHAMALMQTTNKFGMVSYQPAQDLNYNVDFVVSLLKSAFPFQHLAGVSQVGIQTAMRKDWKTDTWTKVKDARRRRRAAREFDGKVFWLTNATRRHAVHKKTGTWLFTREHIYDLSHAITGQQAYTAALFNDADLATTPSGDLDTIRYRACRPIDRRLGAPPHIPRPEPLNLSQDQLEKAIRAWESGGHLVLGLIRAEYNCDYGLLVDAVRKRMAARGYAQNEQHGTQGYTAEECDVWLFAHGWSRTDSGQWLSPDGKTYG